MQRLTPPAPPAGVKCLQPSSTYLRPPGTRRLWMLTPDHLATNRQRIVYKLITPPTILTTNTVFKNPSLRDVGEFRSFEQKLPILPAVWFNCYLVSKSCPTLLQPHGLQHVRLLSTGFSRQEYWSGLPFPPPGDSSQPRNQTRVSCIGR